MDAHAAILEALLVREETGLGRVIEIAVFDGMAGWMAVPLLRDEHVGRVRIDQTCSVIATPAVRDQDCP